MRPLQYILVLCLIACGSLKNVDWLKQRPEAQGYYIGIAKVSKAAYPDSYQQKALEQALGFMSSEIKVSVASATEDISRDHNGVLDLDFTSKTFTVSKEDLEGYETVDVKQTSKEYAIYCRLSKSKYLETKRKPIVSNLQLMSDVYSSYLESVKNRSFYQALDLSYSLKTASSALLTDINAFPYLNLEEISLLNSYGTIYGTLIEDTKIKAVSKDLAPLVLASGNQVSLMLTDEKDQPWLDWQASVFQKGDSPLAKIEKSKEAEVSLPASFFIWDTESATFVVQLERSTGRQNIPLKKLSVRVPITMKASLGNIYGTGIPDQNKTALQGFIHRIFSQIPEATPAATGVKIDVKCEFEKAYNSSSWVSGNLKITFTRQGANKSAATLEGFGSGISIGKAVGNGLEGLEKQLLSNELNWK